MKSNSINGREFIQHNVVCSMKSMAIVFTLIIMTCSCTIAYVPSYTPDVPVWAPPYNNIEKVQYYYLPDIECYYDVLNHDYIYREENNWMFTNTLPPAYDWYDLNNAFAVVIDVRVHEPWRHADFYASHYPKYYYRSYYKSYGDANRSVRGFDENEKKEIYKPHVEQHNTSQNLNHYNGEAGYNNQNNNPRTNNTNSQYNNGQNQVHQQSQGQANPTHQNNEQSNGQNQVGQYNGGQNPVNQQGTQTNPPHQHNQNGGVQGSQTNNGQNQGNQPGQGQTNQPHQNIQNGGGQGTQTNNGQNQGNQPGLGQTNQPHQNGQQGGSQANNQNQYQTDLPATEQPHPRNGSLFPGTKVDMVKPSTDINTQEPMNQQHNAGQNQGGHNSQGQNNQNPLPATEQPHPANVGHLPVGQVIQTRPPVPVQFNSNVGKPVKVNKEMLRPQPQNQPKQ